MESRSEVIDSDLLKLTGAAVVHLDLLDRRKPLSFQDQDRQSSCEFQTINSFLEVTAFVFLTESKLEQFLRYQHLLKLPCKALQHRGTGEDYTS